ncbi:uncharacterized protein LOC144226016 [Crocuta crocuta]
MESSTEARASPSPPGLLTASAPSGSRVWGLTQGLRLARDSCCPAPRWAVPGGRPSFNHREEAPSGVLERPRGARVGPGPFLVFEVAEPLAIGALCSPESPRRDATLRRNGSLPGAAFPPAPRALQGLRRDRGAASRLGTPWNRGKELLGQVGGEDRAAESQPGVTEKDPAGEMNRAGSQARCRFCGVA